MKTIDYLLTTFNKTKDEILEIIKSSNIKSNFLVGNQCNKESVEKLEINGQSITIYNQKSIGTSVNRNYLLKKATADYVSFVDDDQIAYSNELIKGENIVKNSNLKCLRFNTVSDNKNRPVRTFMKKYLNRRNVSSVGAWGVYFDRNELIKNNLFFDENVGPGCKINHGEDSLFLLYCKKYFQIRQFDLIVFHVLQESSSWRNDDSVINELFSHGYLFRKFYGIFAKPLSKVYSYTHKKYYPDSVKRKIIYKEMCKGIQYAVKNS